ncbi:MAG: flagellar biosynthesis anti-sigma factor FlgM [Acidobacteriia bacterium]|nr:flagellar biosynthesis anti-sigma factor FlgM [Terriglobia bacterium]
MRIDPQNPVPANTSTSRITDAQSGTARSSSLGAASEPNDTVQLSSGQATVRQLVSQLAQVPDIRTQQVSALQAEIQSGKFNRSNDQVAGAITAQLLVPNSTG